MSNSFDSYFWHDSVLLEIVINRENPGNCDTVLLKIRWADGKVNSIIFKDCYFLTANMNFGIIAEEAIFDAECVTKSETIDKIQEKWGALGVTLNGLKCYKIITASTNSSVEIYSLSFEMIG